MSDGLSYTIHPQPSGVKGTGCIDRLNCQTPLDAMENPLIFEGIEPLNYLTHQSDIIAELNINRSYDDLLDVSTIYLGTDLAQMTDVFNAKPSFPITLGCHTDGKLLGGEWLDILLDTGASKSYMSKAYYMCHPIYTIFLNFNLPSDICKLVMELWSQFCLLSL